MSVEVLRAPKSWPRVVLARAGRYDPDAGLAAAEREGAWEAWKNAVSTLDPEGVLATVTRSGLRGRGGAGFPTGQKWRACRDAPAREQRYVVANGYEADPGALLDRTLMEQDPHAVLEGLALACFAVGASRGVLAVKADYAVVLRRLAAVIAAVEGAGYIGRNIMGAGFDLQIEVRPLQGSFMLGEETVLLRAIENRRGMPDQRPPYPATRGLWDEPTVVNNVETLAAVPWIVANGAAAYLQVGRAGPDSPGTTLVQISGAAKRAGVVEAPMGVAIGEIVERIGDGTGSGQLKAVLLGGPSGGFLPADHLDVGLDYKPITDAGGILGSGSLLVADERACIVELATLMQRYVADEACGKTIPCRIGTRRLTEIGERFMSGRSRPSDPQLMQDLASDVRDGALCGLEYTAPNPLLTGMRYFAGEFEDHILRSTCPAGVCRPIRIAAGATH